MNLAQERITHWCERLKLTRFHGELPIKRRPVCGKGHDSVLARRTGVAGRFGAQHGLAVRPEFSP